MPDQRNIHPLFQVQVDVFQDLFVCTRVTEGDIVKHNIAIHPVQFMRSPVLFLLFIEQFKDRLGGSQPLLQWLHG